jgi:hypothetical protein
MRSIAPFLSSLRQSYIVREILSAFLLISVLLPSSYGQSPPSPWVVNPGWWTTRGVISPGKAADDYSVVNQGQLKHLARMAVAEMNYKLTGGAGATLNNLVSSWGGHNNGVDDYAIVNQGQLKALAQPFYDRLLSAGIIASLPSWVDAAPQSSDDDYALVNIGQVKNLFSFGLPNQTAVPADPIAAGEDLLSPFIISYSDWKPAEMHPHASTVADLPKITRYLATRRSCQWWLGTDKTQEPQIYLSIDAPQEFETLSAAEAWKAGQDTAKPYYKIEKTIVTPSYDLDGISLVGATLQLTISYSNGVHSYIHTSYPPAYYHYQSNTRLIDDAMNNGGKNVYELESLQSNQPWIETEITERICSVGNPPPHGITQSAKGPVTFPPQSWGKPQEIASYNPLVDITNVGIVPFNDLALKSWGEPIATLTNYRSAQEEYFILPGQTSSPSSLSYRYTGELTSGKVHIAWRTDWPFTLTNTQKQDWIDRYEVVTTTYSSVDSPPDITKHPLSQYITPTSTGKTLLWNIPSSLHANPHPPQYSKKILSLVLLGGPGDLDWDKDGIPNEWEIANGMNPWDPLDIYDDPDGDFLFNIEEYENETDPRSFLTPSSASVSINYFDSVSQTYVTRFALNDYEAVFGQRHGIFKRNNGVDPSREYDDDWDQDGLSNLAELQAVPPSNPRFHENENGDDDGDGLPNGWEILNGLNPFIGDGDDGAEGDPDGDGWSNKKEFEKGSLANSNLSAPVSTPKQPGIWMEMHSGAVYTHDLQRRDGEDKVKKYETSSFFSPLMRAAKILPNRVELRRLVPLLSFPYGPRAYDSLSPLSQKVDEKDMGRLNAAFVSIQESIEQGPNGTIPEWGIIENGGTGQFRLRSHERVNKDITRAFLLVDEYQYGGGQKLIRDVIIFKIPKGRDYSEAFIPDLPEVPAPEVNEVRIVRTSLIPLQIIDSFNEPFTNLGPLSCLKIAKMTEEGVLTSTNSVPFLDIDKDRDRFYIRVPEGASLGGVSVKVSTEGGIRYRYDNDITQINLQDVNGDAISKSLMLVSDDVDDDFPVDNIADDNEGDRTYIASLGSNFVINQIKIGAGPWRSVNLKSPIPASVSVDVNVVILKDSVGGEPVITESEALHEMFVVQERFAQAQLKVDFTITIKDPPEGVDLLDGLHFSQIITTAEEIAVMEGLGTNELNDVYVFFVNFFRPPGATGYARIPLKLGPNDPTMKYINNAFISVDAKTRSTVSHELGHIFINQDEDDNPINLMYLLYDDTNTILSKKRLYDRQDTRINNNGSIIKYMMQW